MHGSGYSCIFHQPWWLDAVAQDQWGDVIVGDRESPLARLPYVRRRRFGFTLLAMPHLTQTLGPWVRPSRAKYAKQLSDQKDLMTKLIRGLPKYDYFCQNFHYSIANWMPFYWQGFNQTTLYTYVLEDIRDSEKIWSGLLPKIRTDIRKARERFKLEVVSNLGLDKFLNLNELSFENQGRRLPYSRRLVGRLDRACIKHDARKMFFAVDAVGRIHAAVYIVWDDESAYYIMGGRDPRIINSGATSLCLWEAINFASTVTEVFNFEGSMIESIERFFRGFGAIQKPYHQISAMSRRMTLLIGARQLVRTVLKRDVFGR